MSGYGTEADAAAVAHAVPHAPQEDAAEARWRRPLMGAGVLGAWCMGVAMVSSAGGKSFGGSKFGMENANPYTASELAAQASQAAQAKTTYKDHAYGTAGSSSTMKHTWPASDPVAFAAFMLDYFPTTPWLVGNQSWVDNNCATWGKVLVGNMTDSTFQLHAVQGTARPDGGMSVNATEQAFSKAVDGAMAAGEFTPLMDFNVGLYTEDLDYYVERLTCGGVSFLPIQWADVDGGDAYSLLVHVPNSLIVLELMGTSLTKATPAYTASAPRLARTMPPTQAESGALFRDRPSLYAVKISYATSNATAAAEFYEGVLLAEEGLSWSGEGLWELEGTSEAKLFDYPLDSSNKLVEVHYWQHDVANDAADLPVADLVDAMGAAHAATHVSNSEGFDQWNDWHYGHRLGQSGLILDDYTAAADAAGSTYTIYTDYSTETGTWAYYMYVDSPGGTSVQLVGNFSSLAAVPDGVRVFDTCYSEGGYTIDEVGGRAAVAELYAGRDYTDHPNYDRLALKLENSQLAADLDACQV